jgi:hypothetical protein
LAESKPQQQWWIDLERVLPTKEQLPGSDLRSGLMEQLEKYLRNCDSISNLELRTLTFNPPPPSRHPAWEAIRWLLIITLSLTLWLCVLSIRDNFD